MSNQEQHEVNIGEFDIFFKDKGPPEKAQDDSVNEIFEDGKSGLGGMLGNALGALSNAKEEEGSLLNQLGDE